MTRAAVSSLIAIAAFRAFDDQRAHSVRRFCCRAPRCTVGSYCKKPPKTRFKKFVKSTNHTCACNGLRNFECEAQATGNGNKNLKKLPWKNSWNQLERTYVLADFWHLELLCAALWTKISNHITISCCGYLIWLLDMMEQNFKARVLRFSHLLAHTTRVHGNKICPSWLAQLDNHRCATRAGQTGQSDWSLDIAALFAW